MSEHEDETGGAAGAAAAGGEQKTRRKQRSDKGKPRSHARGAGRFQRRAEKAKETVQELVRIRMPELDTSELSFAETVDRDADAWGDFLAQLGEWFVPFGTFLDLFFGVGLVRVLRVAPSFRAGRRELVARRERIAAERAEWEEDQAIRESIAADHEAARTTGVFAAGAGETVEPTPEQEPLTREQWLARQGNGGE